MGRKHDGIGRILENFIIVVDDDPDYVDFSNPTEELHIPIVPITVQIWKIKDISDDNMDRD